MTDREKNLGLRVGDTVIHCNREFTIVDIRCDENSEGMRLYVHAIDPDQADKEQRKNITQNHITQQVTELVRKLADKGLGGIGGVDMGG